MYIRVLANVILLVAFTAGPASGAQIYTVADSTLTNSATRFYPLSVPDMVSDAAASAQTTVEAAEINVPPGFFISLACVVSVGPTGGTSWTFTLIQNGNPTSLSFSINNPVRSNAVQPVTPVTVSAGDTFALRVTPTNTPPVSNGRCTLLYR